ncbi:MAG: hypothetical protein K2W86_14000 [Sphingomonas sp.]|uniref:hypothetical protein n=1 Tax=Sphingomonas sp. TaxID=28214 RepID=UPI0035A90271|nr:hypothetical protein [Sphingomonas sp.]
MSTFNFTKGPGKVDWLNVVRADGTRERIDCPKQRIIPHDMVHYIVEREIGARGFMSRVRDGEAASFAMIGDAESDGIERLVEVVQADAWSGGSDDAAFIDLYRVTCDARDCQPLPIDASAVRTIRARIAALQATWDALPVGATLTLDH